MKSANILFAAMLSACLLTPAVFAQGSTQPPAEPAKPAATEPKKEEPKKDAPKTDDAAKEAPKKEATVYIHMKTSMGDIYLELDQAKAPISTENFVSYADKGFYDGTIFHRVIPTFMIQCGGMLPDMKEKPTDKPIKNEWQNGLKNVRGTVAMARKGAGPDSPNSATSQFFINVKDNSFLDSPQPDGAGYAVFGKVIAGMDVVDKIKAVPTGSRNPHANVPMTPVVIEKVSRMTKEEADKVAAKK
jgi:cyclophilin family peptidyl-prolyl cis-trans isomerase